MLSVTGKAKITKIKDISAKVSAGTIYFGTQNKNTEQWDNHFFNAILVGEACEKSFNINDKDSIYITSCSLQTKEYKGKDETQLVIFDFIYGEEEIQKEIDKLKADNKPAEQPAQTRTRTRKK